MVFILRLQLTVLLCFSFVFHYSTIRCGLVQQGLSFIYAASYTGSITTATKILIYKTKQSCPLYSDKIYRYFANHTSRVALISK